MSKVVVSLLLCLLICVPVLAQEDPNAPADKGFNAWFGLGMNPKFGQMEEARVGYEGLLPNVEVAAGFAHFDAPPADGPDWAGRAYLIAHALDTQMVASFLGNKFTLPDGDVYGGLFGQYAEGGAQNFSGGYLVGGEVAWPKGWNTFLEYQVDLWNKDMDTFAVVAGLVRKFR